MAKNMGGGWRGGGDDLVAPLVPNHG